MKNLYKQFLIIFAFLISSVGLKAQISGPAAICQNTSANYTCSTAATYNWSVSPSGAETISDPSVQNPDISFSAAGNYTITVNTTSPANTYTLATNVVSTMTVDITIIPSTCGAPNAAISLVVSGGTSNYTYQWDDLLQQTTMVANNLYAPAIYNCVITDGNGCVKNISAAVSDLPSPVIDSINAVNASCNLGSNGSATVYAETGGSSSLSYTWLNSQSISIGNGSFQGGLQAGEYQIVVSDGNGCQVTGTATILNDPSSSDILGTIYSNSTPITAGQVILLTPILGTTYYDTIATTILNASGQYSFTSAPAGDYILKCVPDSTTYPTLIDTYYGDVAAWYLADTIHHDCSANSVADINVIEPILMTGPGVISGTIIEGFGFGSRLINSNTEVQVPGGPLKDIDVNLVSLPTNTVVAQATSDFNGYYEFTNVAIGNYSLQIDILGLPMDSSYLIIIDPLLFSANVNQTTSSVFTNLDFVADGTAIYIANSIGIKQNENKENGISIYPNPAKNTINIRLQSGDKINGQIEIIDNLSKTVASQNLNSELTQVNIVDLNSGIYFVKIKSEKGINTFRFIKN